MAKILVVDDEEELLQLVSTILNAEGYQVLTANSGQKALKILEKESVDLILLDVMMPNMDGWEVVREIKENPRLKDLSIAMLTVKTMSPKYFYSNDIEGIVDYVNKPFSKKELVQRVQKIFNESDRIESIDSGLKSTAPDFLKEYEELSKTESLYENLMKSLEFSLANIDRGSDDYKLITETIDYNKILLGRLKEKKDSYEKLIKQKK
jgi:CheY-like chemotaxis protein